MSIRIGHKATADSAVSLLQACHSNIRRFLATARALGSDKAASLEDLTTTSASVSRYFREALPLHVSDEEDSVVPRLERAGLLRPEIVRRLREEHAAHDELVVRIVSLCDELGRTPAARADIGNRLRPTAADLSQTLESHLAFEEEALIPLLPRLGAEDHLAILGEMRKRRGPARVWP